MRSFGGCPVYSSLGVKVEYCLWVVDEDGFFMVVWVNDQRYNS